MPKSFQKLHNKTGFKNTRTKSLVRAAEKGKDCHKGSRCLGAAKEQTGKSGLECGGKQVGTAQTFLGSCCAQRQPPQLWGCSNREKKCLQMGLRPRAQHRCVLGSPLLAILCCHQERQKLCACSNCLGLVMLFLQSDSAQSLCLAFREDLPQHAAMMAC